MVEQQSISTTLPLFSIVIAVYDDWIELDPCLRSIEPKYRARRSRLLWLTMAAAKPLLNGFANGVAVCR